ncbi:MAG: hemerythrin domain-containing protein [Deltaproteobacteria bacterium]|nr:hemerythrin domain-containing protein [Deltaproteobacteria bacterium]
MLVTLGRRAEPTDLVGLLLECHQRIRTFLHVASELGRREDLDAATVATESARCARYFTEALPLHVADEEESILPRLRGVAPAVDAALAAMHAQHQDHGAPLGALLSALGALGEAPGDPAARARVREAVTTLEGAFEEHLALEETVLFPALAARPPEVQRAIREELRGRRSAPFGA